MNVRRGSLEQQERGSGGATSGGSTSASTSFGSTAHNGSIVRLVAAHATAVVAEWASVIAVLVLVFDRSGADATGIASVGLLVASLVMAPFAGRAVERIGPQRARVVGLAAQALGCAAGAIAGTTDLPLLVVLIGPMVAQGAATVLRPSGAVLMPASARTSRELVIANLWIWYVEGSSVLVGPLLATVLLAAGGPSAALTGCAVSCLLGAILSTFDLDRASSASSAAADAEHERSGVRGAWTALRGRAGLSSVLAIVFAQYLMIGALDFVLVVIARDDLALGEAGPGLLSTAFGAGAVVAVFAGTKLITRARLAVALGIALAAAGSAFIVFGIGLTFAVAVVVLPILGVCRSVLDGASRMMLQRSVAPESLGSVFIVRELCAGFGMIGGALFALIALQVGGAALVLQALGVAFVLIVALAARGLRVADDSADVPVVEMSLLRRVPVFAPLPAIALESVARSARTMTVPQGSTIITQGEPGDRFYVVADGCFDVSMSGAHVRDAVRNDSFGEVALLADVARTATVTASTAGTLLAIDRAPFLVALTGTDSCHRAAWQMVQAMTFEPDMLPDDRLPHDLLGEANARTNEL